MRARWASIVLAMNTVASAAPNGTGWQIYSDNAGTRVDIPRATFSVADGAARSGSGNHYTTAAGDAELSIYVLPSEGLGPAAYLREHMKDAPSRLDYRRVTSSFFAVSKYAGVKVLYRRCNFDHQAAMIHCIDLSYPASEEHAWDGIVTRISRSLRPL
jgi:hypothetical protein